MHTLWLNALWALAPTGILAGAISLWQWQRSRDGKRRPVGEKLLRPPGESLRQKLREIDHALVFQVALFSMLGGMLPFVVRDWPQSATLPAQLPIMLLLVVVLTIMAIIAICLTRRLAERQNYQLGFNGERLVGEALNKLMLDGCHVFHDIPAAGVGNIATMNPLCAARQRVGSKSHPSHRIWQKEWLEA